MLCKEFQIQRPCVGRMTSDFVTFFVWSSLGPLSFWANEATRLSKPARTGQVQVKAFCPALLHLFWFLVPIIRITAFPPISDYTGRTISFLIPGVWTQTDSPKNMPASPTSTTPVFESPPQHYEYKHPLPKPPRFQPSRSHPQTHTTTTPLPKLSPKPHAPRALKSRLHAHPENKFYAHTHCFNFHRYQTTTSN